MNKFGLIVGAIVCFICIVLISFYQIRSDCSANSFIKNCKPLSSAASTGINFAIIFLFMIIAFLISFFLGRLKIGQPSSQSVGSTNRKYTNGIVFYDQVYGYVDPYPIFMYYLKMLIGAIVILAILFFGIAGGDDQAPIGGDASGAGGAVMLLAYGIIFTITGVISIGFIVLINYFIKKPIATITNEVKNNPPTVGGRKR